MSSSETLPNATKTRLTCQNTQHLNIGSEPLIFFKFRWPPPAIIGGSFDKFERTRRTMHMANWFMCSSFEPESPSDERVDPALARVQIHPSWVQWPLCFRVAIVTPPNSPPVWPPFHPNIIPPAHFFIFGLVLFGIPQGNVHHSSRLKSDDSWRSRGTCEYSSRFLSSCRDKVTKLKLNSNLTFTLIKFASARLCASDPKTLQ